MGVHAFSVSIAWKTRCPKEEWAGQSWAGLSYAGAYCHRCFYASLPKNVRLPVSCSGRDGCILQHTWRCAKSHTAVLRIPKWLRNLQDFHMLLCMSSGSHFSDKTALCCHSEEFTIWQRCMMWSTQVLEPLFYCTAASHLKLLHYTDATCLLSQLLP